ncbi:glycosyltransferase family 2 protein [Marichromatium bheemlicum]|uniref:Glycosyltransferase n=1 Tax=Marichromatium bheemlicum TaxID=365339 RepID=A0ABX1ICX8_9GAMM|nr:glycosyltransferase [Marichromatium bheemlicum]NKN34035.1 glycosyltransferase [Marichromatium bheemlicum]
MTALEWMLIPLLTLTLVVLTFFSSNLATLSLARLLAPRRPLASAELDPAHYPEVLVQLPLYNEGELVGPLLEHIAALDWPRERLRVQVLDDSTDDSLALSEQAVARACAAGLSIELIHRRERTAFKAGALAAGLECSDAPLVAIFDADFAPPPDFLRRTVAVLKADPGLAYVQTRWAHRNRHHSLLTRVQARLLDSHFRVEQEARWRLGLPVPFNGTGGLWRREAIRSAGGWQGDTLTEDLDLSLRAHLRGWRSAFLGGLEVPAVLPTSTRAWRAQQFRWSKGFAQCFLKLAPMIWSSPRLAPWQKLMISLELAQPLAFLLGSLCLLMGLPFIAGAAVGGPVLGTVAILASVLGLLAPVGFLVLAGHGGGVRETTREVAGALVLTSGLLLSNARAGAEALLGHRSEFVRTPKRQGPASARRRQWRGGLPELVAGLALLGFVLQQQPVAVIYLLVVIGGLLGVGVLQVRDALMLGRPSEPHA